MDEGVSKLLNLVKQGNLQGLKELVEDTEVKKRKGDSLLNAVNREGMTVLHIASYRDHSSIIRWVLSSSEGGGRVNGFTMVLARSNKGATAMHLAAFHGHLECCQALVEGSKIENGERAALLHAFDNNGMTVLHYAAQEGHSSIIRWLLSSSEGGGRGAGFTMVLAKTIQGATVMHLAALNGHLECCQALVEGSKIENGERAALLNTVGEEEWTVLHIAAQAGHASIIRWLLSCEEGGGRAAGFTMVLAKTIQGATAMHLAALDGHLECCQALVEDSKIENGERAALLNTVEEEGWTVLHVAAQAGHASIIRWLLSCEEGGGRAAGFTMLLAKTSKGATAMHFAAERGHLECFQALVEGSKIENGKRAALLNDVNNQGFTLLHFAASQGRPSIIRWLLSSSEGGGRAAGFTMVLAKTIQGATAMHLAAGQGHLECCQALVEGSKIENGERAELLNAVVRQGCTALHLAADYGRPSIIRWLLSSSEEGGGRANGFINVLVKTSKGATAMHYAAERGHLECCQALLEGSKIENGERAALLNAVGEEGWTALHYAADYGRPSIIGWLLSSSEGGGGRANGFINVLVKTSKGATAMHLAAGQGHLECCQALVEGSKIENGERAALLNAVGEGGWTALHYAADKSHSSIIRWLLSCEEGGGRAAGFTNVLAKTSKGATPMHFASANGHVECCQALVEGSKIENGERAELLNAVDDIGWTALHVAAQQGHPSIIRWLLSSSEGGGRAAGFTNILARTNDGRISLQIGTWNGHLDCCQALVEGSKIENGERAELLNAVVRQGWTVLHLAAQRGHISIIRWLLSSSEGGGRAAGFTTSSITMKATNSITALLAVIRNGSVEALNALLAGCTAGERLTLFLSVDEHGWTPLHSAARFRQPDIIRELLLHHPETQTIVDARDHRGMTALHRAVIGGIDEESKKEWQDDPVENNTGDAAVIDALLTAPPKDDEDDNNKQAAQINANLGTKIE